MSESHRAFKEQNAEWLMLVYYEYLLRIRTFLHDKYSLDVLTNLEQFPLEMDESLKEYYSRIARVDLCNTPKSEGFRFDRFYIHQIKPIDPEAAPKSMKYVPFWA